MASSAWSEPPRSATGCTERTRLVRVAVNVEQLLYKTPGGIGRYTAQLVTLLRQLFPEDDVVPFTARHSAAAVDAAFRVAGLADGEARRAIRLPLPRPVLYDAWHLAGIPPLGWMAPALGACPLIHAPSVAVPPVGRSRLVVNVHDVAPLIFPETFPGRGRRFHQQGIRAAARRADLVITGSQASADELAAWTAIPVDRVRVVHNGVDATPAPPEAVAAALARARPRRPALRALGRQPRAEKEPQDAGVGLRPHCPPTSPVSAWPSSGRPAGSAPTSSTSPTSNASATGSGGWAASPMLICGPCTPAPGSSPFQASMRASGCPCSRRWCRPPRWCAPTYRPCGR